MVNRGKRERFCYNDNMGSQPGTPSFEKPFQQPPDTLVDFKKEPITAKEYEAAKAWWLGDTQNTKIKEDDERLKELRGMPMEKLVEAYRVARQQRPGEEKLESLPS